MLCAKSKIKKCFARQFKISLNRVWALQLQNGKLHHLYVALGFYVAWDENDRYHKQQNRIALCVSFYKNRYINLYSLPLQLDGIVIFLMTKTFFEDHITISFKRFHVIYLNSLCYRSINWIIIFFDIDM